METDQNMLKEKFGDFSVVQNEMENNQIMLMEKLGVLGILKESFKIPYKCPKFVFLTFLTSLPLIFVMVLHEVILQTSMLETKSLLTSRYYDHVDYSELFYIPLYNRELQTMEVLFRDMSPRFFQLGFLYLVPLHLLDLINAIIIIISVSTIYTEKPIRLMEMLLAPIKKTSFTGPLITSIYVIFLNCFTLFGLVWALTNSINPLGMGGFFMIIFAIGSFTLAVKWIEWSSVWNMSIVFSVLDERRGIDALGASEYFSKGNRKSGFRLMLLFFVWRILLRVSCLYVGGHEKWVGLLTASFLSCVGNVMKWVVCTVYFYDCKRRTLEKKVDVEEKGKFVDANQGLTECNNV